MRLSPSLLAAMGSGAGFFAWLVSEPFAHTAATHGTRVGGHHFTLGSFFGWFAHAMLGALVCGTLGFAISAGRASLPRASLNGLLGAVLGGVAGWGSDAWWDAMCIRMLREGTDIADMMKLLWHLMVAVSLALCVVLVTHPTPARLVRGLAAGAAAAAIGFVLEYALLPLTAILMVMRAGPNLRDLESLSLWQPFDPSRLVERMALGLVLGLALGLSQVLARPGWLRLVLGRNEGRDYPLEMGVNRIGAAEGIEVSLYGDPAVAPLQAQVVRQGAQWLLHDAGSGRPTFLNGAPLSGPTPLREGDHISIGSSTLQFRQGRGPAHPVSMPYREAPYPAPVPIPVPAPTPPPARRPRLVDEWGREFPLAPGVTLVGRDPSAGLPLPHEPTISRQHAEIECDSVGATVRDLGSANGTRINGAPAAPRSPLRDGDQVQFGRAPLIYRE